MLITQQLDITAQKVSAHTQEIPQSNTADQPTPP